MTTAVDLQKIKRTFSLPGDEMTIAEALRRVVARPYRVEGYAGGPCVRVGQGGTFVADPTGTAFILPFSFCRVYDDIGNLKQVRQPHHAERLLLSLSLDEEKRVGQEHPREEFDARDAHVYGPWSHTFQALPRGDAAPPQSICRAAWIAAIQSIKDRYNGGAPHWLVEYFDGLAAPMVRKPLSCTLVPGAECTSSAAPLPKADDAAQWATSRKFKYTPSQNVNLVGSAHGETTAGVTLKCNYNGCGAPVSLKRPGRYGRVLCMVHRDSGFIVGGFAAVASDSGFERQHVNIGPVWAGETELGGVEDAHEEQERLKSPEERAVDALADKLAGGSIEVNDLRVVSDPDSEDYDPAAQLDSEGVDQDARELSAAARMAEQDAE